MALGLRLQIGNGDVEGYGGYNPELVTNGDFANGTTGWTAQDSTLSVASGELVVTRVTSAYPAAVQDIAVNIGEQYTLSVTGRRGTTPSVCEAALMQTNGAFIQTILYNTTTSNSTGTITFTAAYAAIRIQLYFNEAVGSNTCIFDNVTMTRVL